MSLFEPSKEILAYLVAFREAAPTPAAPPFQEVRQDLDRLFDKLAQESRGLFVPVGSYEMAAHALAAMADQVVSESGWKYSPKWEQSPFLIRIMGKDRAGINLLTFIRDMRNAPPEVNAVFYLCLALGYHGELKPEDHGLLQLKKELLRRLPGNGDPSQPTPAFKPVPPRKEAKSVTLWAGVATGLAALVGGIMLFSYQPASDSPQKPISGVSHPSHSNPVKANPGKPLIKPPELKVKEGKLIAAKIPIPKKKPAKIHKSKSVSKKTTVQPTPSPPQANTPLVEADLSLDKSLKTAVPYEPPTVSGTFGRPTHDLQAGVFVGPIQAARLASSFLKAGFPARVEYKKRKQGGGWYVVYLGPLNNQKTIEKARQYMKKAHNIKAILKDHKPTATKQRAGLF